jgi:hypothetical protein
VAIGAGARAVMGLVPVTRREGADGRPDLTKNELYVRPKAIGISERLD